MNHVLMNFSCPKCESLLYKGAIDMDLNNSFGIIFSINCPECAMKIKVNGFLPKTISRKIGKREINSQKLEIEVEKIKNFKGKNIANLFNE
jgi:ribosomal protein L37AE/L43A